MEQTYILPIRRARLESIDELAVYLDWLAKHVEVIVVDGSSEPIFAAHAAAFPAAARHCPPAPDLVTPNGKVGGVLTGVRYASHDKLLIADDDVRYSADALHRMAQLLDSAECVRPQNYFAPLPWHARWDTARTLLNRATGGDWPGTLGVRRALLLATGGYASDVLFENLELVRTIRAAGGREIVAQDLFVRRIPPSSRHFWSQRVRQAYDEFARPARLVLWLSLAPIAAVLALRGRWSLLTLGSIISMLCAEVGRRRAGGTRFFPASAVLLAPFWIAERAICSWLAVWRRLAHGGIRYGNGVLRRAATPMRQLRMQHRAARLLLDVVPAGEPGSDAPAWAGAPEAGAEGAPHRRRSHCDDTVTRAQSL